MEELGYRSARDVLAALDAKELSSVELLDHLFARVDRHNPAINAVVTLDAARARDRAGEADAARSRGERWGPLHGLPMTVKDAFETEGLRTTCGATDLSDHVPLRDADAVARLKAAGAIVFGKTNLPAYAADIQTANEVFGTTNNPWAADRIVGGSSGGSAAALAAGLTPLELGSDIGGSIRNPAHFCGVYGHKPTYGIVPGRGHIPGPPGSLTVPDVGVFGPLARSVADLELAMDVLAAPSPERAVGWRLQLPPPRARALAEYRISAWLDDPASPVDPPVLAVLRSAVDRLVAAGAKVDDAFVPPVPYDDARASFQRLVFSVSTANAPDELFEMARGVRDLPPPPPGERDDPLIGGGRILAAFHREWVGWVEEREQQRAAWAGHFVDHDIVLAPVINVAAFPHDWQPGSPFGIAGRTISVAGREISQSDLTGWCGVFGVMHLPATVVPVGRTADGLPVGIQIVGPHLEDRTTLHVAQLIEDVLGGFERPPGF